MSGRIVAGGRVVALTPELRQRRVPLHLQLPRDKEGAPVDCAFSAAEESVTALRSGIAVYDREEKTSYRCVKRLDPLEGWAPTEFWQARWKVAHSAVIKFVEAGFLDAAVEEGSQVRRYRCRDEWALLNSPVFEEAKRPKKRLPRSAGRWSKL